MTIPLQFNVKPGDVFRYRSSFTMRGGSQTPANTAASAARVEAVRDGGMHVATPEDPEAGVMVYDRRGYPVDILDHGVSIKADMPDDIFDISNQLIFPERPVGIGDTWEASDGTVRVAFRLVAISAPQGRQTAEIHATADGYAGPIKYWVEVATGWPLRQEYTVGGTSTVVERQ